MRNHPGISSLILALVVSTGCGDDGTAPGPDIGSDAGSDAMMDAAQDAGSDAEEDASLDTGADTDEDATGDGGTDAGADGGDDVGLDEVCDDGADNDGDGAVDCDDDDCSDFEACAPAVEICEGDEDEDGDGAVDCDDTDCAADPACFTAPSEDCGNGEDDDFDGAVDCADTDCARSTGCVEDGVEACDDGVDNDEDGDVDCDDTDCARTPDCFVPTEDCGNGYDDDGDGAIDCDDPDCAVFPICAPVELCDDGVDNDSDGDIDCDDSDCAGNPDCVTRRELCANRVDDDGDGDIDCEDSDCRLAPLCVGRIESCGNGEDDDGDGDVDCDDSDCRFSRMCTSPFAERCGNGFDDDRDGLVDCDDGECIDDPACVDAVENCSNGTDDDADGLTDCADPGCFGVPACEGATEVCDDDVDNDGDGLVDCLDLEDCLGTDECPVRPTSGGEGACPTEITLEACSICFSTECCAEAASDCVDLVSAELGPLLDEVAVSETAYEDRPIGFAASPWSFDDFVIAETQRVGFERMQDGEPGDPAWFGGSTGRVLPVIDRSRDEDISFATCDEYAMQTYYTYELYRRAGRTRTSVEWARWAADEANEDVGGLVATFVSGDDIRNVTGRDYPNHGLPDNAAGNAFQRRRANYAGAGLVEGFSLDGAFRNEYHALTEQTLDWIESEDADLARRLRAGRRTDSTLGGAFGGAERNRIGNDESWQVMSDFASRSLTDDANTPLMTLHYLRRQRFRRAVVAEAQRYNDCISRGVGERICELSVRNLRDEILELLDWAGANGCLAPPLPRPVPGAPSYDSSWAYNACDFSAHDLHDGLQDIFEPLVAYERDRCEALPVTMSDLRGGERFEFETLCDPDRRAAFDSTDLNSDYVMRLKLDLYDIETARTCHCG